jgi:hypothetical protein
VATIDESKFGRLTADLLVRKGDAEPSDIRRLRKRKNEAPPLNLVPPPTEAAEPIPADPPPAYQTADVTSVPGESSDLLLPYGVFEHTITQGAPKKQQHRIMIVLTEEEHETLGILAVKKGFTRHQVLRKALDGYLEWLVDEYGTRCRCLSTACSTDCDHSSAAEVAARPTDVE